MSETSRASDADCKTCGRCKMSKARSEYHSHRKRGLQHWCRDCTREYAQKNMRGRQYYRKTQRPYLLKYRYGLTAKTYDAILSAQGRKCALCFVDSASTVAPGSRDARGLVVDHSHETGRVRGLLCNRCNRAIGMFDDDLSLMVRAAKYTSVWWHR